MKITIVNNKKENEFAMQFWERSEFEQSKSKDQETIVYSPFSISYVISKKLFFIDFLYHPLIIQGRKFYDLGYVCNTDDELLKNINKVLEYELTSDNAYLSIEERDQLIKFHKKLQQKITKKYENAK